MVHAMEHKWQIQAELLQAGAGCGALLLGLVIYLFSRDPQQVYFLAQVPSLSDEVSLNSGRLGNVLPSFLHIYAFILLTTAVVSASPVMTRIICVFWVSVECLFEIGQHAAIAHSLASHLHAWTADLPMLWAVHAYFMNGTFDVLDIVAILLGACAAYATVLVSQRVYAWHSLDKS